MKFRKRTEVKNWKENLHVMNKITSLGINIKDIKKVYYITEKRSTPTDGEYVDKMVNFKLTDISVTSRLRYSLC